MMNLKLHLLLSLNVPFFVGKQEPAYLKFIATKAKWPYHYKC